MSDAGSILPLLQGAEALGRMRSREHAYRETSDRVLRFLGGRYSLFYKVSAERDGLHVHPLGWKIAGEDEDHWISADATLPSFDPAPLLADCHASESRCVTRCEAGDWIIAFAIGEPLAAQWLLEVHCGECPPPEMLQAVALFLDCFRNQQLQWAYANLDTLTHLLNRKTFEENFDQLIDQAARAQFECQRPIGPQELARPCWLGVIDIDHFKRVNDTYGHLFGDEVLLRIADLMRHNFRASDKLFRFGGEEFVVMIYHADDTFVGRIFDRFRRAVEAHQFPQIGQVTCSIGYTRIDPSRLPAELLGRADEALYFSKDNGRNLTSDYEDLVRRGLLKSHDGAAADHQAEADIFFD
ncbi:MAG: GGDEF domain-containing protein [Rhodocyclaceae bacterium]|nr:GGDEF domain-containing protein [Rhodocyclaceae bacterium]